LKRLTSPEPPDSPLVDAAILVGGRGRRLGGTDKSALVVDGTTVLARELAALAGVAAHVVLVGDRPGATPPAGVRVVADAAPEVGPLGGIHTALAHATTDRTLILACDMPFLSPAFLAWLAGQGRETDVTVPRNTRGLHPLCAVWSVTAAPVVKRLLDQGVRKVGAALDALHVTIVEGAALAAFDPDGWLLHNINTPDDYARALARRG
jgi:molybdopterin-guanine dinucleotide biosynthesis protein A